MIRIFSIWLFLIFPLFAHAESGDINDISDISTESPIFCNSIFEITGPEEVKIGSTHEYKVITTGSGVSTFSGSITYTLIRDDEIIQKIAERDTYLWYFTDPGKVILEAKINASGFMCEGPITRNIRVYKNMVTYIGSERFGVEVGMGDIFEKNDILYKSYIDIDINTISTLSDTQDILESIDQSDIFIVGNSDILGFFSDIVKIQKTKKLNFIDKKIYIISSFSRSFLSKVLASSLSQIGATKVFLISEDQFYGLITRVSSGQESDVILGEELSYEKSQTVYSLGGFLEFLAYAGFSYQLLAFLLSITFVVLVLNILKQIVGFNVFGIYYPILFAITIASLGISAFIFVIIGFISIGVVNFFSKKVHLLLHAKRSLLISLYIVLFLFILGIDNFFELSLIDYAIFDNPLIIFPLFITIILADKIFQEDINVFSRMGLIDLLQYGIITFVIYGLLEYKALQYFLVSYPDSIILVVFLNILVGRYMGLQVFEYFRFSPLLKKINEEE